MNSQFPFTVRIRTEQEQDMDWMVQPEEITFHQALVRKHASRDSQNRPTCGHDLIDLSYFMISFQTKGSRKGNFFPPNLKGEKLRTDTV